MCIKWGLETKSMHFFSLRLFLLRTYLQKALWSQVLKLPLSTAHVPLRHTASQSSKTDAILQRKPRRQPKFRMVKTDHLRSSLTRSWLSNHQREPLPTYSMFTGVKLISTHTDFDLSVVI